MSPRMTIAVAAGGAVLVGGLVAAVIVLAGSSDNTTTTVEQPPLTTTAGGETRVKTVTVSAPEEPQGPPLLNDALTAVRSEGFTVPDSGTYHSDQPVAVLIGLETPTGDGTRQQ